jgi:hypothetical protein
MLGFRFVEVIPKNKNRKTKRISIAELGCDYKDFCYKSAGESK